VRHDVGEAGQNAADEVKEGISEVPEGILDVVAKDPEIEHVAGQVKKPAVQEHGGEQGQVDVSEWGQRRQVTAADDLGRDDAGGHDQLLERTLRGLSQLDEDEDDNVRQDDQDVNDREGPAHS